MRPWLEEAAIDFQWLCRQAGLLPHHVKPNISREVGVGPIIISFQAEACYRALETKGDTRSLNTLKQQIVEPAVQSTIFYPEMAKLALG